MSSIENNTNSIQVTSNQDYDLFLHFGSSSNVTITQNSQSLPSSNIPPDVSNNESNSITIEETGSGDHMHIDYNNANTVYKNPKGEDGITPHIGENGHWFIGDVDTEVVASGPEGKNVYQLWLEEGNTGTFNEFLATLKGDKGEPGELGLPGETGDPGTTNYNELENIPTKLSDFENDLDLTDVYFCIVGITTYELIEEALTAGKIVVAYKRYSELQSNYYYYSGKLNNSFEFRRGWEDRYYCYNMGDSLSHWQFQSSGVAYKGNLVDGSVTKIGTTSVGNTTKPIYLNAGVPTECSSWIPSLVTNSTDTSITIGYNLASNTIYTYTQPIVGIFISKVKAFLPETTIYFTTASNTLPNMEAVPILPSGGGTSTTYSYVKVNFPSTFLPNTAYSITIKGYQIICTQTIPTKTSELTNDSNFTSPEVFICYDAEGPNGATDCPSIFLAISDKKYVVLYKDSTLWPVITHGGDWVLFGTMYLDSTNNIIFKYYSVSYDYTKKKTIWDRNYSTEILAKNSSLIDGSVTKVGTTTKGSSTKPIYLNNGVPTECNDYPSKVSDLENDENYVKESEITPIEVMAASSFVSSSAQAGKIYMLY